MGKKVVFCKTILYFQHCVQYDLIRSLVEQIMADPQKLHWGAKLFTKPNTYCRYSMTDYLHEDGIDGRYIGLKINESLYFK